MESNKPFWKFCNFDTRCPFADMRRLRGGGKAACRNVSAMPLLAEIRCKRQVVMSKVKHVREPSGSAAAHA